MNNLRFRTQVNLTVKKPSNAYMYTSSLIYNAQILNLFLKTHTI